MPSYTMDADLFTMEKADFDKVLRTFMKQEMTKAIKVFLRACLAKIPVRTGFLKGSFTDIASSFGIPNNVNPTFDGKEYYRGAGGKILKTTKSGIQFAIDPAQVIENTGSGFSFNIAIDINYYRMNDFFNNVRGTPWESLDAGAAAMTSYLEEAVTRFPDISAFLTKISFKLSGGSLSRTQDVPDIDDILRTREFLIQGFD